MLSGKFRAPNPPLQEREPTHHLPLDESILWPRVFRPQVQQPEFIGKGFDPPVETDPAIGGELSFQSGVDLMLGLGPKLAVTKSSARDRIPRLM